MSTFKHHPDGWIYLAGERFTLAEFISQVPAYSLPEGYVGRDYDPNDHHDLIDAKGGTHPQPMPWEDGDTYIASLSSIRGPIEERRRPPPESPPDPLSDFTFFQGSIGSNPVKVAEGCRGPLTGQYLVRTKSGDHSGGTIPVVVPGASVDLYDSEDDTLSLEVNPDGTVWLRRTLGRQVFSASLNLMFMRKSP